MSFIVNDRTRALMKIGRLAALVFVICLNSLQFGSHMSELNAAEEGMTCALSEKTYDCIKMSASEVGFVTSIYPVGGFVASSFAGGISDRLGCRKLAIYNAVVFIIGSVIIMSAGSVVSMAFGRFIAGLAAGSAIVNTPIYLAETSPPQWRGLMGCMNQCSICFGILLVQIVGLCAGTPELWRWTLRMGTIAAVLNFVLLFTLPPTKPRSHSVKGTVSQAAASDEESLLTPSQEPSPSDHKLSFQEFLTSPAYRKPLIAAVGLMLTQQLSGINVINFYGVKLLRPVLPESSSVINVGIQALSVVVTVLSSFLVDEMGRKFLLEISVGGMAISSGVLLLSMINDWGIASAAAAMMIVVMFGCGLGAIPFLIISEFTPAAAVGYNQSLATTANWLATFFVGFIFPILSNAMGNYVFAVFLSLTVICFFFVKAFVPETKGKSVQEVW